MQVGILKQVISDQREEVERILKEGVVERDGIGYAREFLKHPNALAVMGVRRCGKSVFSMLLSRQLGEGVSYVNFDDERLMGINAGDLNKVLQALYELYGEPAVIILDEIQNVSGWELFVSRLRRTRKVVVTGSNSKLMGGELASHLTGRYVDFTLYPFSFRETVSFKPDFYLTGDIAKARRQLDAYVRGSGFPEFGKFGSNIVVRTYEDIINKDCVRRHNVRDAETFRELARYLMTNSSKEFTYSKLSNVLGIKDVHTAKNYVSYIREAFMIAVVERFSPKLKQQFIAPKKVYAIDHGFCNFIGFRLSEDIGRIFENIVCIELLRKKAVNPPLSVYYWKDHQGSEVDFVVKDGLKISRLIQVCYDIDDEGTKQREVKALVKASSELGCDSLIIITDSEDRVETIKGKKVEYLPLWKWLLG